MLAGQVDAIFTGTPALIGHIRSGRLRPLAVSSAQRIPTLPDVPTVAESGYPGFEADQWYGVVAPAGTPAALVAQLNAEINKALALPDVKQRLAALGAEVSPAGPEALVGALEMACLLGPLDALVESLVPANSDEPVPEGFVLLQK